MKLLFIFPLCGFFFLETGDILFVNLFINLILIFSVENWSMYTLLDVEVNTECGSLSPTYTPR